MNSEQPKCPYLVFYRNLDSWQSFFYRNAQTFDEAVQLALSCGDFVNDWHNDVFIAEYVPLRMLGGRVSDLTESRMNALFQRIMNMDGVNDMGRADCLLQLARATTTNDLDDLESRLNRFP